LNFGMYVGRTREFYIGERTVLRIFLGWAPDR